MSTASMNIGFVRELSHWYFCGVSLMAVQMLLLLLWSFLGPGSLDGIMDSVYGPAISGIGKLFFAEQMSLGNAPLGLSLLFLTVMLYSFAAGTIFYLGYRLYFRRAQGAPE